MNEVPPGGTNTFSATANMASIEYSSSLDKFLITTAATTTGHRCYLTNYNTTSQQFERIWGVDLRQIDQSIADSTTTPFPCNTGGAFSIWIEGGVCYIATIGTTALTNRVYAVPLVADWEYSNTSFSSVIMPAFNTPNVNKYVRAYVVCDGVLGGSTGKNLGMAPEPFRISYRTTGISDNSGAWTIIDDGFSLAGVSGSTQIQFKLDFRTLGVTCIPARILAVGVVYDDISTDTHYQFSVTKSSASSKQFAWRFSTAFGGTVPRLRVRLYDAVTGGGGLLVDDDSTTQAGTWERSTDGSTWSAWNSTDKGNETTYLRFTPASLADNIKIQPVLTLY